MLSWLSYGLEKVIPQPAPAPGLQALGKSFETSIDIADEVGDRSGKLFGIFELLPLFTLSSFFLLITLPVLTGSTEPALHGFVPSSIPGERAGSLPTQGDDLSLGLLDFQTICLAFQTEVQVLGDEDDDGLGKESWGL